MRVQLITHMGSDALVVDAARVSFAKRSENYSEEANAKLIRFLAREGHWTPFGHPQICLHVKAPMFVARQLAKHQVGMVWNEVSRRYVDGAPEMFTPVLRKRAEDKKQGSTNEPPEYLDKCDALVEMSYNAAQWAYRELIRRGVCPEQARAVIPAGAYTEWFWTGSLAAWARVYRLRTDKTAQAETADIARQVGEIIQPLFPVSWEALTNG